MFVLLWKRQDKEISRADCWMIELKNTWLFFFAFVELRLRLNLTSKHGLPCLTDPFWAVRWTQTTVFFKYCLLSGRKQEDEAEHWSTRKSRKGQIKAKNEESQLRTCPEQKDRRWKQSNAGMALSYWQGRFLFKKIKKWEYLIAIWFRQQGWLEI